MTKRLPPIHPGENLKDWMDDFQLSANRLALDVGVPNNRILAIVGGKRSITADTALRLARYFRTSVEYWMNLQTHYEIARARHDKGAAIERRVQPLPRRAA